MKKLVILTALMAASGAIYAAQTNTGCQGNCPDTGGATTINNAGGTGGNGYGGNGGTGGNGGSGGVGIGLGGAAVSTGGSVVGSGNSSATGGSVLGSGNATVRTELNQHQNQQQSSNNRNNNSNSSNNSSTNTSYGSVATTAQSTNVAGDSTVYQAARIPVATAYAPTQYPTAPCVMGASLGFQAIGFGMSAGAPIKDEVCQFLEKVRSVSQVLGQPEVAREMMAAYDTTYAEALKRIADRKPAE